MSMTFRQLRQFDLNSLSSPIFEYDLSGTVYNPGVTSNLTPATIIQPLTDYLQMSLDVGYPNVPVDLDVDYATARYFYGQSYAQSVSDGNGGTTTTYYVDHGIAGTSGADVIADPTGNNVINAGDGDDLVMTGAGNDGVLGGRGKDLIFTGSGDDTVDAGGQADIVYLGEGNDLAKGGGGADEIYGEAGQDRIFGNNGKDLIDGGADDDILTGGNKADTFVFRAGSGSDIITDFAAGEDVIRLEASTGVLDFQDVQDVANQIGTDLVLRLTSGDNVILEDTTLSQLSSGDFEFV